MVKHVLFSFWDSQGLTTLGQRPGESRTRGAPRDSPWELGLSMEEGEAHHVCPEHHPSTAGFSLLALWKNFWKWLMFNLNVNTAKALSVPCIILQRPVYSFFFFFFPVPAVQKTSCEWTAQGCYSPMLSDQPTSSPKYPSCPSCRAEPLPGTTCPCTAPRHGQPLFSQQATPDPGSFLEKLQPSELFPRPNQLGVLSWLRRHKAEQCVILRDLGPWVCLGSPIWAAKRNPPAPSLPPLRLPLLSLQVFLQCAVF